MREQELELEQEQEQEQEREQDQELEQEQEQELEQEQEQEQELLTARHNAHKEGGRKEMNQRTGINLEIVLILGVIVLVLFGFFSILSIMAYARDCDPIYYTIKGQSMRPVLVEGDVIEVCRNFKAVGIGDVVVFKNSDGNLTAHQIVIWNDSLPSGFVTMGITNNKTDNPISRNDIVGVWNGKKVEV